MFSKSITNSSQFLMMPSSSQNLYFHLGMNADDDGFCEHFTIMRMTDSKPDDLKILQAKGFITVFDDKVLVINQWKENNYLRIDRYTPSKYLETYKQEMAQISQGLNNMSLGIPDGNQVVTQVRLGQESMNTAPPEGDIIENILESKTGIQHDFQFIGLEVFEKTGAPAAKKGECIRLAKQYPGLINPALSFCLDYPNPALKWKMFIWKLNQLRKNEKHS